MARINLDPSKLLGFRLQASLGKSETATLGSKVGGKIGTKPIVEISAWLGAKVGEKGGSGER